MRYAPLLLMLALVGCASNPKPSQGWGGNVDPQPVYDTIVIHPNIEVGQYWETTTEFSSASQSTTERWCVTRKVEDCFIVEHQTTNPLSADHSFARSTAYLIDPQVNQGKVLRAWRGVPRLRPREIEVLPSPVWIDEPSDSDQPRNASTPIVAGFMREVGGKTLFGKRWLYVTVDEAGNKEGEVEHWYASNGWFGGLVESKHTTGATTFHQKLTKLGTNGKSWLDWKGVDVRPDYQLLEDKQVDSRE